MLRPRRGRVRQLQLRGCRVDLVTREVLRPGGDPLHLTSQEARLLARLAATPGQAVSRQTLLVDVWDYHPDSRSRAPDVAVRRLRTKIEPDPSEPVHVCTVLGHGWVLLDAQLDVQPERPAAPALLVGRQALVASVEAALLGGPGLCLVGPPGVGKTELARQVLAGLGGEVVAVSLAAVRDEGALLAAIAAALKVPVAGVRDVGEHVGTVLRERELLLWLDAPEAVVGPLAAWLAAWPVRVLVTSRVEVEGLATMAVPPLSQADAQALFQRLAPGVEIPSSVIEGLDGLPLGIRLAAARARQLGAQALLGEHGLRYERVAGHGAETGLADSIARSWALLDPVAEGAMVALSALVDGFDLADAEAVTDTGGTWVGDVLLALVASSLLVREPPARPGAGPRYRMLESIRWFAAGQGAPPLERLVSWVLGGGGSWPTQRHLLDLVEQVLPGRVSELVLALDDRMQEHLPLLERQALLQRGAGQAVQLRLALVAWRLGEHGALDRIEAIVEEAADSVLGARALVALAGARRAEARPSPGEIEALRAALARTTDPDLRVDILRELAEQHADRREFRDARLALQQALAVDRGGARRAELLCAVGHVALKQDAPDEGLAAVEEAVQRSPDGVLGERGWRTLGGLRYLSGDHDGAAAAWEHARELARDLGLWRQHVVSLGNLGLVYADLGDDRHARRVIEEALARSEELAQVQSVVPNLLNLAQLSLLDGDIDDARALLHRAVALADQKGWSHHALQGRLALAIALQLEGGEAEEALQVALAEAERIAAPREAALARAHLSPRDEAASAGLGPSEARLLARVRARG